MGRGSSDQRAAASKETAINDKNTAMLFAERAQARSKLMPEADAEANSQGYSDQEKDAITGSTMESSDAAFNAGEQQMKSRAAQTGSSAGMFANMADLATKRAQTKGDQARTLTAGFADEKQRRRSAGRQMQAGLYGVDTNLLGNVSGLANGSINAGNGAISGGVHLGPFGNWG